MNDPVLDVIEDWNLPFHESQVIRYVARAKRKGNELQDLKKAEFYLRRKIAILEGSGEKAGVRVRPFPTLDSHPEAHPGL